MIELPWKCPRGLTNICSPLSQIMSDDEKTFICCGVRETEKTHPDGDIFTVCFKSETTDSTYQLNKTDMKDQIAVMSMGLAIQPRVEDL